MSRFSASLNLIFYSPVLIVTLAILLTSPWAPLILCVAGYAAGLGLLLAAKRSLFQQGVWCSCGPARMSPMNRQRYLRAYTMIGLAGAFNLQLIMFVAGH